MPSLTFEVVGLSNILPDLLGKACPPCGHDGMCDRRLCVSRCAQAPSRTGSYTNKAFSGVVNVTIMLYGHVALDGPPHELPY